MPNFQYLFKYVVFLLCLKGCFGLVFPLSPRHKEGQNQEKVSEIQAVQLGKQERSMTLLETHTSMCLLDGSTTLSA